MTVVFSKIHTVARIGPVGFRASANSCEVGRLKCRVRLPSSLPPPPKKNFSKGVRNRSHGVFAVLEVLSVSHVCRSRPMVVDLSASTTTLQLGMCPENHTFYFSVNKIASSASTALTTTMLT